MRIVDALSLADKKAIRNDKNRFKTWQKRIKTLECRLSSSAPSRKTAVFPA
jgi:hypothetical protein